MSWFDDHATELEQAGISQASARDFESRNPGDFSRIVGALSNSTDHRPYDSQTTDPREQAANAAADAALARGESQTRGGDSRVSGYNTSGGGYTGGWYGGGGGGLSMADLQRVSDTIGPAPQRIQPFTEQFSYADFAAPTQRAPGYAPFVAPEARAPGYAQWRPTSEADLLADPSWKTRMKEAQDAIERSAAASGSYLTPNTMQSINRNAQDYASNEFGNVDTRRFRDWGAGYNRLLGEDENAYSRGRDVWGLGYNRTRDEDADLFGRALTTYGTNRGNQRDIFDTRRNLFEGNEANRYNTQRTNRLDEFGILTGNRNFGLANQNMDLANRQFDYSRVTGDRNFGLANREFDYARLTGDRNFGLTNREFDYARLTGDRNFGLTNREFDYSRVTGDRNFGLTNRQFDFTRDQDAWNRNRTGYLDDFGMQNKIENDYWDRYFRQAELGRPT